MIWKGPLKEDDREQQVQVVENFIGRHVDGIVLAPLDNKALVAPVETAARGKIPVVIIDSGLASNAYTSFVATDNREGGRIAARNLGKLLGGKGNAIMLRYAVGSASTPGCSSEHTSATTGLSRATGTTSTAAAEVEYQPIAK